MGFKQRVSMVCMIVFMVGALIPASGIINRNGQPASEGVLAIDPVGAKLSSDVRATMSNALPSELINVWVEFDLEKQENETGVDHFYIFIRKYAEAAFQKFDQKAFVELLPEETLALIWYAVSIEPPVELVSEQPQLQWKVWRLTSKMITDVAAFPGVKRVTLSKDSEGGRLFNWAEGDVAVSYLMKVAEEYPDYHVELYIDLRVGYLYDPETGFGWSWTLVNQTLQKYGGQVTKAPTGMIHDLTAVAPPSLQLVQELAVLPEVSQVTLNWGYTLCEP